MNAHTVKWKALRNLLLHGYYEVRWPNCHKQWMWVFKIKSTKCQWSESPLLYLLLVLLLFIIDEKSVSFCINVYHKFKRKFIFFSGKWCRYSLFFFCFLLVPSWMLLSMMGNWAWGMNKKNGKKNYTKYIYVKVCGYWFVTRELMPRLPRSQQPTMPENRTIEK